jgi:putative transposase
MKQRRRWAQHETAQISLRQKCALLSVNRSSVYYEPTPVVQDDVGLMNEIGDIYAKRPFQGYKRITDDLQDLGYSINHKKVYRLKQKMGLKTVYPKLNLSKRRMEDAVHPYLLRSHPPIKPHDCWCVDITYIKTSKGFVYLTALIDAVSRCVMGWSLSISLDTESCLDALVMALKSGYKPRIINSDQGCQFTSHDWTYSLSLLGIKISMDGKGRCLDNIPIERFWRTLKYEEVYLKTYDSVAEARQSLETYIQWYNHERRHSSLGKNRPHEVMIGKKIASKEAFLTVNKNVENSTEFTHSFINTTTTKKKFNFNKNKKELSSQLAA